MAAACNAAVTCMETAGEGGSYGMALLAAYLLNSNESLEEFLNNRVFKNAKKTTLNPEPDMVDGFNRYMEDYKKMVSVEEKAVEIF